MALSPLIILGGRGMLGQDLRLVFSDLDPLVFDRDELDITDQKAVAEKLTSLEPAVVINAAAYNLVDQVETDDGLRIARKVNAEGPRNLAQACRRLNAVFVHYSTDYVFEGTRPEGYREDDLPNPQSRYAKSKREGEEAALAIGGRFYLIRTCRLFGNPGASEGSKKSFVDLMLFLAKEKKALDVVNEEVASPTYTKDLAEQTRRLLEGKYVPGIYHITNSGVCTWYEFAQEIFRQAGITISVRPVSASAFPRPAARPAYSALINTKLPPMRSWQDALRDYLSASS